MSTVLRIVINEAEACQKCSEKHQYKFVDEKKEWQVQNHPDGHAYTPTMPEFVIEWLRSYL
jgi:hypothetical protein